MCSFKQFNQGSFCCSSRISLSLASMRLTILQQCFFVVSRWSIISVNILFVSIRNPAISFWRRLCRIMIDSVCLRGIFWKCLKRADAITMRLILILEECAARRGSCGDWILGPLFVITSHLNGGAMPGQHQTAVGIGIGRLDSACTRSSDIINSPSASVTNVLRPHALLNDSSSCGSMS